MKKTNKKGFTLVELLAVIVILGVLLLIAVPAVQNIIKSSKRKAFDSAIKLTIENIETLASTAVDSSITPCYVTFGDKDGLKINKDESLESEITLERGSYGSNTFGIVVVNDKGKGTAYANGEGGTYYVKGNTINNVVSVNKLDNNIASNYATITSLISAYANGLGKCSAQNWWS